MGVLCLLLALGCLAAAEGRWERAACLLAAEEARRQALNWPPALNWQAACEGVLAAARAALSEEALNAAQTAGRALTLQQAIEYALYDAHDDSD